MKFITGLGRWVVAVTFAAIFFSLGLTLVSEVYGFEPNPRNVLLAILASGTLIWWALPRVRSWWRWQREFLIKPFLSVLTIAIFGAADAYAETIHAGVLTPPDTTQVMQWNLNAINGPEFWAIAAVATVALAIIYLHFFKRYFD